MSRNLYKVTLTNLITNKEATVILAVATEKGEDTFIASEFEGLREAVDSGMEAPVAIFMEDAAIEVAETLGVERVDEEDKEDEEEDEDLEEEDDEDDLEDEEE